MSMAGDASSVGAENESAASQANNPPLETGLQPEPPLKGIKKYMSITMPSEVSSLDPLGHYAEARMENSLTDLKKINPELAVKLRQEKEKWFEGVRSAISDGANIDFQKAMERLNIEMEARLEISNFLTKRPDVITLEKWLGEPDPTSPLKPRGVMMDSNEQEMPPNDNLRKLFNPPSDTQSTDSGDVK